MVLGKLERFWIMKSWSPRKDRGRGVSKRANRKELTQED